MKYAVRFPTLSVRERFEKTLEDVFPAKARTQIMESVESLASQPRPHGALKIKPPLEIFSFLAQHRLRVGNYRVLYDIDDSKKVVWILALRRRSEKTYK